MKIQIIADNIKDIFNIESWFTATKEEIINTTNIKEINICVKNRIPIKESHSQKEKIKTSPIKALKKISFEKISKHKKEIARISAVATRV